jgi:uncharacterized heparinase superfamily protein
MVRWIEENTPGEGNGWEPYPLSRRVVNWIKWALAGNALTDSMVLSLAIQARFLRSRIEWHLLGNHLFANAKALVVAGVFFEGEEADVWRTTGLSILARELHEQILADGGHFELSPMYHSLIEEDLLDLLNLAHAYPGAVPESVTAGWRDALQRMRGWLLAMSHPDGGIAFFNDAAHGIAPSPGEIEAYAERLGLSACPGAKEGVTHLPQSGFVRVQQGDLVALLDVGRVGPDYLPGHAHADTLSFELSVSGQRVIVNCGTSLYEAGSERLFQRSTAAHNTVEVDGKNSSDVWGSFRMAQRARPLDLRIEVADDGLNVMCGHDGYRRLAGRVTHRRQWRFRPDGFAIEDWLDGSFAKAKSFLHLHPDIHVLPKESLIKLRGGRRISYQIQNGIQTVTEYSYHPEFGLSQPARCLEIEMLASPCTIHFSFE